MPSERPVLTDQEWLFYRCISTPSVFSDWIRPYVENPATYHGLWPKQIREINREAKKKRRIQSRYIGKSLTCSDEFKQACVLWTAPTGTALFATRNEGNLEPVFTRELIGMFKKVPFLQLFLPGGDAGINRKQWTITLLNGVTIRGRIEGIEGAGFMTIHPDVIAWWDETQLLSDEAIGEAYGMVTEDLPQLASGVPNGVRTSWAYRIDTDETYGWAGGKMTRHDDPRYTAKMDSELLNFFGGAESSGYMSKVLGLWGADARMTFDMDRIIRDLPIAGKIKPPFYRSLELHANDVVTPEGTARLDVLQQRFAFKGDMPKTDKVWFHADHGQSASPTTLYLSFFDTHERCWRQYHRVLLWGMEAPTQAEVIHWLALQIKAMAGVEPVIGMDTTGHGGSAVMALLQLYGGHPLMRVDVREAIDTGDKRLETDDEQRRRYAKDPFSPSAKQLVPIYQRMRQIAFPRLAREFYSERLRLVSEDALVKQLSGATDYENKAGDQRIYETDYHQDGRPYSHDLSSMEIFGAMLHVLDVEQAPTAPKAWIQPFEVPGWGLVDSGFGYEQ